MFSLKLIRSFYSVDLCTSPIFSTVQAETGITAFGQLGANLFGYCFIMGCEMAPFICSAMQARPPLWSFSLQVHEW